MNRNIYALIGNPVGHTLSPFIHNRLFELSEIDAEYRVIEIAETDFQAKYSFLKNFFSGYNVTLPYKTRIIPLLDDLDILSSLCGSVNTVKNQDTSSFGYTTDGYGFVSTIRAFKLNTAGRTVIVGAGGVSGVCAYEIVKNGGHCTIVARSSSIAKASEIVNLIKNNMESADIGYCELSDLSGDIDLLVNATPCGMYPNVNECPISDAVLKKCRSVFDLIYNPWETLLMSKAKANGAEVVNGLHMLVLQAVKSHEIWNGSIYSEDDILSLVDDTRYVMKKKFA